MHNIIAKCQRQNAKIKNVGVGEPHFILKKKKCCAFKLNFDPVVDVFKKVFQSVNKTCHKK